MKTTIVNFSYFEISTGMGTLRRTNILYSIEDQVCSSGRYKVPFMPGLHSRQGSTRQDENESVKSIFVLSSTLSTCSCLVSKLSETSW